MNDNVDQLISCARLAGVSPSILIDGAEQIRAVARRRLAECDPKTSITVLNDNPEHHPPSVVPDAECESAEFVLNDYQGKNVGNRPTVTLTLEGTMTDIQMFMQAIGRAVKDNHPLQPMLDLLRGAKGKPLHIVCQLAQPNKTSSMSEQDPLVSPGAKTGPDYQARPHDDDEKTLH